MNGLELNRPTLLAAVAGFAAGVLLAASVAVMAWPDPTPRPVVVEAPVVPPEPDLGAVSGQALGLDPAAAEETQEPEEPEPVEGEEPTGAALLPDAAPAGEGPLPDTAEVSCPAATTEVGDAEELQEALDEAEPGDSIALADGTYQGQFVAAVSGSADDPIFLCGDDEAVLDGGDVEDGYTLHLDGASRWRLVGFTVTGGEKGVMADGTVGSVIQGLTVTGIGDEAVHLRSNSTDNVVRGNTISGTGLSTEKYGEGVYIGSAVSNWCTYTDCEPDRSDRNVVIGNTITGTTSESVDIKEGTTGGAILDNVFDGTAITEADGWVNVKGNNYLIRGNRGTTAPEDGFKTHEILPGWGDFNVFADNHAEVNSPGWAIASWPERSNVVRCSNTVANAGEGLSNIPCT